MTRTPLRKTGMVWLAFLLALTPIASAQESSQPLGRLFFTPERRQILDRQRQLNIQEKQEVPEDPTLTINGIVTRSSGKRTVWINGVAQNENDNSTGVVVIPDKKNPGKITVRPDESPSANAKVGDTVNRNTGETADILGGGSIDLHRTTPAKSILSR